MDILTPDKLLRFNITLDGDENMHNSSRVLHSDQPTYKKIMSNIKLLLNLNYTVEIRMNFTKDKYELFKVEDDRFLEIARVTST